jgi:hypothetical protein
MRFAAVVIATSIFFVAATASGSVGKVSFTASVSAGDYATLTVNVSPRSRCTIKVVYDTTVSHAKGLGPKTGGKVTWRWRVGTNTHAGRWPVTVDCGKAGKLVTRLRVKA